VAAERAEIVRGTACSPAGTTVVLLNLRDQDGLPSGACSGSVIAPRAVLTAAHCLAGETGAVRVYPGTGDVIDAISFHIHPRYREDDSSSPDVGVVLTGQDVPRPTVPLLWSRDAAVGEQAVIAGWGKDEFGRGTTLRAATTVVAAVFTNFIETRVDAAGSGVCSGDSGGPILLSEAGVWAIAGVTSAGSFGGSCIEGSNYFTNVRHPDVRSFIAGLVPGLVAK
jgi:secreted trypsin-like serine protease